MAYNNATRSYTMESDYNGFSWVWEGLKPEDSATMVDAEFEEWADRTIENCIELEIANLESRVESQGYPSRYESEETYLEAHRKEIRDDIKAERDALIDALRDWATTPTES